MDDFHGQEFHRFIMENGICGFFKEEITLASGRKTHFYANWRNVSGDAYLMDKLSDYVIAFARQNIPNVDTFYGVPEGATKLGIITQFKWAREHDWRKASHSLSMGRGKAKDHGEAKDRYFVGLPRGNIAIIEDVTTTGSSLIKSIKQLQDANLNVIAAISLMNRMERRDDGMSVKEAVEKMGPKMYSMSTAVDVLPELYERLQPGRDIATKVEDEFERYGVERIRLQ